MNRILACELSGRMREVAVLETINDGMVLLGRTEQVVADARTAIDLPGLARRALDGIPMRGSDLDIIAVCLGPGETPTAVLQPAFLSLQGLALAFARPLVVVSSLHALAQSVVDIARDRSEPRSTTSPIAMRSREAKNRRRRANDSMLAIIDCGDRTAVGEYAIRDTLRPVRPDWFEHSDHLPTCSATAAVVGHGLRARGIINALLPHPHAPRAIDVARVAASEPLPPFEPARIAALSLPAGAA